MRYLSIYRSETTSTATDRTVIASNYLERKDFDLSIPLHGGLHYVFVRGVKMATYTKGYELRRAINAFLDFASEYNRVVIPALRIESLNDIGVEEYAVFEEYLRRNDERIYLAIKLRSALKLIARNFDDGMPQLKLRRIEEPISTPSEPLSDQADQDFFKVMRNKVDLLREKLRIREQIRTALPYDKWEVWSICSELYQAKPSRPSQWEIDPLRAAATLQHEGYPFFINKFHFSAYAADARGAYLSPTGREPLEFVLSCCIYLGFLRHRAPNCISLTGLFNLMYPTSQDQATLVMFIQRQLGWNKESVLALDKDDFVHPISELASDDSVLLVSQKVKSQGQGEFYIKAKAVLATSNRSDPYSGYNLIQLARDLSEVCHRDLRHDHTVSADDVRLRSPFLFLGEPHLPWSPSERIYSFDDMGMWKVGVKNFLEDAKLVDNGTQLVNPADIQHRLRVTSIQNNKKAHNQPLALTALIYGHSDLTTTDTHYDSSVYAMVDRRKRFHSFQQLFIEKSQGGQFKGFMANSASAKVELPRFRIFTIIGHERALWACMDSSKPSYPGSTSLAANERCTRLDKCNGCNQWCVLEDSLPFLMEREAMLALQIERDPLAYPGYSTELQVHQHILNTWGNSTALEAAKDYRSNYDALLPFDLKSLVAYLED